MPYRPRPTFNKAPREEEADEDEPMAAPTDDIPKPPGFENRTSPLFAELVVLFSRLASLQAPGTKVKNTDERRREWFKQFYDWWRENAGPDLYPVIRLLLPDKDTRRKTYFIKEKTLAGIYIKVIGLAKGSKEALSLEKWTDPAYQEVSGAGDFATIASNLIGSRATYLPKKGTMTIDQINQTLDALTDVGAVLSTKAGSKTAAHMKILMDCTMKMTAEEQKWLIRIILRNLKVGVGERYVLGVFHPDAMALYNTCSDLLRVTIKLWDPNYRVETEECQVKPGQVFTPMLSHRGNAGLSSILTDIASERRPEDPNEVIPTDPFLKQHYFTRNEFLIEEKIDGERIQIHVMGGGKEWQYHSRSRKDYTYLYGKDPTPGSGSLTPYIAHLLHHNVEEQVPSSTLRAIKLILTSRVILDGELIAWDPVLGKCLEFGTLKTCAREKEFGENDVRPMFKVFDILYLKLKSKDFGSLLMRRLSVRRRMLMQILTFSKGLVEMPESRRGTTKADINNYLTEIVATCGEGVVIKNPDSPYILDGRNNNWVKVKPEYMTELADTMDVLVLGGYWGNGKRQGGRHASFLVGLRDENSPVVDGMQSYVTFAKVGGSFNADHYKRIKEISEGKWIDYDPKSIPRWFRTIKEVPDQLIKPSDSFIVQIKASEVIVGASYGAKMTLRFPRPKDVRSDLSWDKSMTVNDLTDLMRGHKRVLGDDLQMRTKKSRASQQSQSTVLADTRLVSDIFEGMEFYVSLLVGKGPDKSMIEHAIKTNGGSYNQLFPSDDPTRVVICSAYTDLVKRSKRNAEETDMIHPDWVVDSIREGEALPLTKRYYVHAKKETMESALYNQDDDDQKIQHDGQNDSDDSDDDVMIFDSTPAPSLKSPPTPIKTESTPTVLQTSSLMPIDSPEGCDFSPFVCYFDTSTNAAKNGLMPTVKGPETWGTADKALADAEAQFLDHGGRATKNLLDPTLTHIIVHHLVYDRVKVLIEKTSKPRFRRIVKHEWIIDSVSEDALEDEDSHKPPR